MIILTLNITPLLSLCTTPGPEVFIRPYQEAHLVSGLETCNYLFVYLFIYLFVYLFIYIRRSYARNTEQGWLWGNAEFVIRAIMAAAKFVYHDKSRPEDAGGKPCMPLTLTC